MNRRVIDPRLVALYNEYFEKGEEYEFIWMLYTLLDAVHQDIREKVRRAYAGMKRKMGAPKRKADKAKWDEYVKGMTPEQLIEFQNTPYDKMDEKAKKLNPKLVKNPERNNYARIYELIDPSEHQKEITASRLTRHLERTGFITSDEEGTHIDYHRFSEVANEIGKTFDQKKKGGLKGQHTRISSRDIKNYVESRVTPKGDKMALLAVTTGLPLWYLAGYENPNPPAKRTDPLARFSKPRGRHKA